MTSPTEQVIEFKPKSKPRIKCQKCGKLGVGWNLDIIGEPLSVIHTVRMRGTKPVDIAEFCDLSHD